MQELKSNYPQVTQQEPDATKEAFACYVALPCVYVILHMYYISNTLLSLIFGSVLHVVNILWVLTMGRSSEKRSNSAADSQTGHSKQEGDEEWCLHTLRAEHCFV